MTVLLGSVVVMTALLEYLDLLQLYIAKASMRQLPQLPEW